MLRIKRTKTRPATPMDPHPPAAVHYATAVSRNGTIDGWSTDPAKAVAVTPGVGRKVAEHHKGRPNVGVLEYEPIETAGAVVADAVADMDAVGAEEFARLQAECKRLRDKGMAAERRAEEAEAAAADAGRRVQEVEQQASKLADETAEKSEQIGRLTTRVADLERLHQDDMAEREELLAKLCQAVEKPETPPADGRVVPQGGSSTAPPQPQGGKKK